MFLRNLNGKLTACLCQLFQFFLVVIVTNSVVILFFVSLLIRWICSGLSRF